MNYQNSDEIVHLHIICVKPAGNIAEEAFNQFFHQKIYKWCVTLGSLKQVNFIKLRNSSHKR